MLEPSLKKRLEASLAWQNAVIAATMNTNLNLIDKECMLAEK